MMPFLALNLSPATYLPRWTLLEETHQFGLEGGVRRGTFAVAVAYGVRPKGEVRVLRATAYISLALGR